MKKKGGAGFLKMMHYLFGTTPELFHWIIINVLVDAIVPYINVIAIQLVVDELLRDKESAMVYLIIAVTISLNAFFRFTSNWLGSRCNLAKIRVDDDFHEKLHKHVMNLPIKDIESSVVSEYKINIEQAKMRNGGVENYVSDFETICRSIMSMLIAMLALLYVYQNHGTIKKESFWSSPFLIVALAIISLLGVFISIKLQSKQNAVISDLNDRANKSNGKAFAYMQFIADYHFGKEIRAFGLGSYLCNYFEEMWTSSIGYKLIQKLGKEKAKVPCISVLCNGIINILLVVVALGKAFAGVITVGSVIVYFNSIQTFIRAMVDLVQVYGGISLHNVLAEPYVKLLELKEEEYEEASSMKMPSGIMKITFEHVYFKYPNKEQWVLEDVSFTLEGGNRLAIVGENGSGKSTIVKLICRLYEPTRGAIKLNGIDIGKYDKKEYWSSIGTVFQDYALPALKLANVISGKVDYDEEKELNVLSKLGMGISAITLDKYIYNDFSNEGIEISGGESQKIAIARALYKNSLLLILDEPTSALDPISEARIYSDFNEACKGKTAIFISHRLQSCRVCDCVLVLSKGKVTQIGAHEELILQDGNYKELWEAQKSLYD